MGRALLVLGWLATLGLLVTAWLGFRTSPEVGVGNHLLSALLSTVLVLFSHCWIMFYLIGTGKAVKNAVAEHSLSEDLVERTREFKNLSYPWLMLAMGVVMTTFIIGGGVATRVIPPWIHATLFGVSCIVQVRALQLEGVVLLANERLMVDLNLQISTGEKSP